MARVVTDYSALANRLNVTLGVTEIVGVVIKKRGEEARPQEEAEASCVHWSTALQMGSVRRTVAAEHAGCSIGSYVHGFSSREEAAAAEDTSMLVSAGWVEPEALSELPILSRETGGLDYVPLHELEVDPQIVLLTLTPEQAMAVQAAIPNLRLTGKPQCQIIPLAVAGVPCASLGCAVSRARTDADPGLMTCALPTTMLVRSIGKLEATAVADRTVADAVRR